MNNFTRERIAEIRKSLAMTQAEFAARCGVNLRSVQKWEGGERAPSGPALMLLAQLEREADARPVAE